MERLVWTSMLFPGYRPVVFDDIPITAVMTMGSVRTGTRCVFTALHRDEADFEKDKAVVRKGLRRGLPSRRGSDRVNAAVRRGDRLVGQTKWVFGFSLLSAARVACRTQ